jgi:hypothetical protein
MGFRDLARRVVLQVPPVRRYHDYVNRLRRDLAGLHAQEGQLRQNLETVEGQGAEEKQRLRLELYVLRSDYQRLVNRMYETRSSEGKLQGRIEQLTADLLDMRTRHETSLAISSQDHGRSEILGAQWKAERESLQAELNRERARNHTLEADLVKERARHRTLELELAQARGWREAIEEINGTSVSWRNEAQRHALPRPETLDAKLVSTPRAALEHVIDSAQDQKRKEFHRKRAARDHAARGHKDNSDTLS